MPYRLSNLLFWGTFMAALLLEIAGGAFLSPLADPGARETSFIIAGLVVLGVGAVQRAIFYRCPHCGAFLGRVLSLRPKECPECGKTLP